jgi:hypothetical protein
MTDVVRIVILEYSYTSIISIIDGEVKLIRQGELKIKL